MKESKNQSSVNLSIKCPRLPKISRRKNLSRVAIRYSKALFELARDKNLVTEVQSDLAFIQETCLANPDFHDLLNNPLIEEYIKANVLKEMFAAEVQQLTFRFLELLSKKRRTGFLLEMIDRFLTRVQEYQGILAGTLIASTKLTSTQVDEIRKKVEVLTGKKVLLSEQIDPSLIGGFIVKIKDTVVDLSIKTQLEKLRTQLVHG
jgi:F-type H+-transporting ATPase subunit delta